MARTIRWALTLLQPYAWMVIQGPKDVENRGWANKIVRELIDEREPFAVHAGGATTRAYYAEAVEYARTQDPKLVVPRREELVYGAILGTVLPYTIWTPEEWSPARKWHMEGRYGWALRRRAALPEPVRCAGKQGFWRVPEEMAGRLGWPS